MFKQRIHIPDLELISCRMEDISNVFLKSGMFSTVGGPEGSDRVLTRFRQNIMGFAAGGAPFGKIEMEHEASNTLVVVEIAFDESYWGYCRSITAGPANPKASSTIDYVNLNQKLTKAAGLG